MEAKDTVIKCDTSLTCCLDCHENQAEVSFKAGQEDVILESKMGTLTVSSLVNRGRKEVVDWIRENDFYGGVDPVAMMVEQDKLKAKLKEWGID